MIPLKDNIPSRTIPVVNYALIGACALAFVAQLTEFRDAGPGLVEKYGMIPARVWRPQSDVRVIEIVPVRGRLDLVEREAERPPFNPWLTLVTCVFLHGGWMHFLGNMWFLLIFGDNVEDRIGHVGYFAFLFVLRRGGQRGALADQRQFGDPHHRRQRRDRGRDGSLLPALSPRHGIVRGAPVLLPRERWCLPAPIFLGVWFVIQFFQGAASITSTQSGGVAWWAHVGGFVVGYLIAAILRGVGETSPPVDQVRPRTDRVNLYRYSRY